MAGEQNEELVAIVLTYLDICVNTIALRFIVYLDFASTVEEKISKLTESPYEMLFLLR